MADGSAFCLLVGIRGATMLAADLLFQPKGSSNTRTEATEKPCIVNPLSLATLPDGFTVQGFFVNGPESQREIMKTPRYAFLAAVLIVLVGVSTANSQTVEWARQLGTPGDDVGSSISADGLGNVYISGHTRGTLDGIDAGEGNTFLSKYDEKGDLEWTRRFGDSSRLGRRQGFNYSGVVADGKGSVYMTGVLWESRGVFPFFLNKYDDEGNLVWTRRSKSSPGGIVGSGVSIDGNGNVFLTGSTHDSLEGTNAGLVDAFVSKYDEEGNLDWTRQIGTSAADFTNGVSADELGNVFITGITEGDLDGPNAGSEDAFVSKFDTEGNLDWTRQLGTAYLDRSYGVAADGKGNVFISGWTGGSLDGANAGLADAFVSKYDEDGILSWTRQFGTSRDDASYSVTSDGDGNVFISGFTRGILNPINCRSCGGGSYYDAFVSKFDGEGNLDWTSQLDFSGSDESRGVSVDGLGNVYISGFTNGSVDGPNAGLQDAFLVKLNDETFVPEPSSLLLVLSAMTVFAGRCRVD